MGHILKKIITTKKNRSLHGVIGRLKEMAAENPHGQIEIDRISALLDEEIADIDKKIRSREAVGKGWDFSQEKASDVYAENEMLKICPFTESDRAFYTAVRDAYARIDIDTSLESRERAYWEGVQPDTVFYCTIVLKETGERIGYIAFKNTASNLWEFAIEILPQFCYKEYGPMAVALFLNRTKEITGKNQYQALVEPDNIPSQRCMNKLNAELVDIFNLMFEDEDEAEQFENENTDLITDHMLQLAEMLDVEPKKLLSNVLDYRIYL